MANLNGGRGWLSDAAAASLHRMDAAYGSRLPITSAGRTYKEQADAYQKFLNGGPLALKPSTSIHETGNACDFGSGAWAWLGSGRGLGWNGARANEYGWRRTVSSESWHYEYDAGRDKYRNGSVAGGSFSQEVKNQQSWLNESRNAGLEADGLKGPATVQAFKNYQEFLRKYGYTGAIDGDWGGGTQVAHQKYYDEYQANKNSSSWDRAIQEKLNRLNYNLTVDGVAGPATQAAIRDFQSKNDLPVDGVAGPITNNKLDAVIAGLGSGQLTVDGDWGAATTRKLQQVLGVADDGQMGPNTWRVLQERLKVTADGEPGPQTYRALQAVVGAPQDGEVGPNTIKALQNYLNAGGNFQSTPTPPVVTPLPTDEKLTVDGGWGPATTRALQKKLGVTVDGEMGGETWTALQKALGIPADGQPGPQTYRSLQTFLGVSVDGAMGPQTIKALQVFLNEGGDFRAVGVIAPPKPVEYPQPATPTFPQSDWWAHSPNSSPRDEKVQYFVVHHAASTASVESLRTRFMTPNDRNVSPNWLIGKDGSISEIVPPDNYRAWTTGAFDHKAVTVETQNTSGEPNWGITEESHHAIAKLVAWAARRYNFPIDRAHVIGHREVPGQSTACPGPSMDLNRIVELAKGYYADAEPKPEVPTEPETPEEPTPEPEVPTETPKLWTIELPEDEARELGKLLDAFRKLLP